VPPEPHRVLQVNKFFRPGAGAESSFLQTRDLLRRGGHDVVDFAMDHPDNLDSPYSAFFAPQRSYDSSRGAVAAARDGLASVYSPVARRCLSRLLDAHPVDVAHLHNIYHQLTLSVVDELHSRDIPIVLTLHDWKVACPAYTLFTKGAPCRRCPQHGVQNAIRHKCVKNSRGASALAAAEAVLAHRRGSYHKVDRFIAPSRYATGIAGLAGIDAGRVDVIENFLTEAELDAEVDERDHGPVFVYAGRLEVTKGIRELLGAFGRVTAEASLRIAGDGPLAEEVRAAADRDPRIDFLGRIPREQVLVEFGRSRAVVLPSVWEENGPFVILEAQARARPMIVTNRGGPPEFVSNGTSGLTVDPEDVDALAAAITRLAEDAELARVWGRNARERVKEVNSGQRHYEALLSTYLHALADR